MRAMWMAVAMTVLAGGVANAGPFQDALKIVQDPTQLATRADEAEKLFRACTEKDPKAYEAWYNIGVLQLRRGDKAGARDSFNKALAVEPKHLSARAQLAGLDLQNPATEQSALAALNDIVDNQDRFQPEARNILAAYEIAHKNWEAAIKHGRNVLLGDKDNINAFLNIAIAYFKQGRYDQAGLVASSALESHPEAAALHNLMGLVYLQADNSRQATEEFTSALKDDPTYDDARINLGALELAYGNFDSALKRFDEALKKDPRNVELLMSRGVALRGLGKFDDAEKSYNDAKVAAPGNAEIDYNLCILHQQYTQKMDVAKTACEAYVARIDKTNPKFAEVQKRLKSINAVLTRMNRPTTPTPNPP
ncbi:MAG: tetratricopeptide repeat protein [Myxococcota bacterium]